MSGWLEVALFLVGVGNVRSLLVSRDVRPLVFRTMLESQVVCDVQWVMRKWL